MVTFMAKMWNMGRTETVTGWWTSVASNEIFQLSGPQAVWIVIKSCRGNLTTVSHYRELSSHDVTTG